MTEEDLLALDQLTDSVIMRTKLKEMLKESRFGDVSSLAELEAKLDDVSVAVKDLKDNKPEWDHTEAVPSEVDAALDQVSQAFSIVFQTLWALMTSAGNGEDDPCEKTSKRDKDFDARLARMNYDLKRHNEALEKGAKRLRAQPASVKLRRSAEEALIKSLRSVTNSLKAYQAHLRLGARVKYPESIRKCLPEMSVTAAAARMLSYASEEFEQDVARLAKAAVKEAKEVKRRQSQPKDKQSTHKLANLELINNLAREKFGAAVSSPKKTNLRVAQESQQASPRSMNVILPRPNRLLEDRSRVARAKRYGRHLHSGPPARHYAYSSRVIDLDEEELAFILRHRRRQEEEERDESHSIPTSQSMAYLATSLADAAVERAVADVVGEMSAAQHVVDRLFRLELSSNP